MKSTFLIAASCCLVGFAAESQDQMTALILTCPTLYQILQPESILEFEKSKEALTSFIQMTYFTTHTSPEAFLMDSAGVTTVDGLIEKRTEMFRSDMKTASQEDMSAMKNALQMCPIVWE